MPWKETDVSRERVRFVVEAGSGREPLSQVCRRFGISRKTGYKWLARWRDVSHLCELKELSRRPRSSPFQTPSWLEERVVAIRELEGWGGRKISRVLKREGIELARSTADQILKRRGLVRSGERLRPAVTRFERSTPNELSQMDFKGWYLLPDGRRCYPLTIVDDHSRYAQGLYALPCERTGPVRQSLIASFERYGVPRAILCDHGVPWWSTKNGLGLSKLSVFLLRQGIELLHGGVGHPQTQGKVERFHRTLDQSIQHRGQPESLRDFQSFFDEFRERYNQVRPHEALGDDVPADHYRPSQRGYKARPPEWQYPEGSELARVRPHGCSRLDGRDYFICHALAGEQVRIQRFGARVLVTYRHMQIRELNLETGRTMAIVRPVPSRNV